MAKYPVTLDQSNNPLKQIRYALLDDDIADEYRRKQVVLALNARENGVLKVGIYGKNNHSYINESRGISEDVTGVRRKHRLSQFIAANPLDYRRIAFGIDTTTLWKAPKARKTRSDKGRKRGLYKKTSTTSVESIIVSAAILIVEAAGHTVILK